MKKTRRDSIKKSLSNALKEIPEAKEVKNRYRLMLYVLTNYYPIITGSVSKDTFKEFLREVVYLDRQIRLNTSGVDTEKKEILSQKFQIEDLDLEVGFNQDIKQ